MQDCLLVYDRYFERIEQLFKTTTINVVSRQKINF